MTSREIRRSFLDFYAARGHRIVPSSPLVLRQDPTLLFANAGMNQFKDVFTGRERREYTRAATVQKCLRVSGKHNDLEQVGRTPRHHTFFEMLGNFSFGDYFKEEAIASAWELVTRGFGLPASRLWVTVFGGTAELPPDEQAYELWQRKVGVPAERILRLGEADNFWRMGDLGPCGPCSEIHYDLGEDLTSVQGPSTPETDSQRFLEIWNLVFMQFDQRPGGERATLPAPSIDTGMGLERICAVLQGKRSNFDTDLFAPLLAAAAARAGVPYGADPAADFSLRVIADHARACCFLVADGVVPANDKRGYVLRRLLRRAIRHGRKLGIVEPFLHEVTPVVVEQMGEIYPELLAAREAILAVVRREEQRFAETLTTGLAVLERSLEGLPPGQRVLPGAELFKLHDTFGFPLDLARDVATERGIELDEAGFDAEMERQRARAQASWKGGAKAEASHRWGPLVGTRRTEFLGHDRLRLDDVPVASVLPDGAAAPSSTAELLPGTSGEVVLEATPFYAEAGGQVGDTGWLVGPDGRARVVDTYRPGGGLIAHRVQVEAGALRPGQPVIAEVDAARREAIRRNHTATHLLHAALREVVGTHVKQAGSLVAPDRLRFDFSHFAPLTERALADVESLVNRQSLDDLPIETEELELDEALRRGAMALFGEKYGERVRMVRIGGFSLELCGGTHTRRTGEVGLVKLVGERGVASGTRRVEAVTGEGALARFREEHALVRALEEQLAVPRETLLAELTRRLEAARTVSRQLEQQRIEAVGERLANKAETAQVIHGVRLMSERVDELGPQELRELADRLRRKLRSGVVVLGRAEAGKASLLVAVTDDLKGRLPAGDLVKCLGKIIGGGGGGRPDLAEAGGKDPQRLDEALRAALHEVDVRLRPAS
ncbi:MAG TPA: alanine--tRNA ligase [Candidatus Polarisedimenticolaceae bacterium]|nr:alanine--tRNA ligase [Candidatus Polarisedimenticolaceae bacterium]